jgi:hypothetical protein
MVYTPASLVSGSTPARMRIANEILTALNNLPGTDVLPAAFPRFLTGVYKKTGYKFTHIGHGRHREVFMVNSKAGEADYGIVLKIGNKQSTAREIALTLAFPEDWAQIYGATHNALVAEYVSPTGKETPEEKAHLVDRLNELATRYINPSQRDVGYTDTGRIVLMGSSIRVIRHEAGGQIRAL